MRNTNTLNKEEEHMKFLSYKKISDGRYLMRLSFEKNGMDVFFEMNKFDRNLLYRYLNREISVEDNGHVTFDSPTFEIKDSDRIPYANGTNLEITLSSLYDGELKLSIFGKCTGSERQTLIGILRIIYNGDNADIDEKMI